MSKASIEKHNKKISTEKRHMSLNEKHILFWDVNLAWTTNEIAEAKRYWDEGLSLPDMADKLRRLEFETVLLTLEMAEGGDWKPRHGGAYGNEWKRGRRKSEVKTEADGDWHDVEDACNSNQDRQQEHR